MDAGKCWGKDHPDTLMSMNNLVPLLQCQGKYKAAEEMNQRALDGYEKVLEKDRPEILKSVQYLASALQDQGKYKATEEMIR